MKLRILFIILFLVAAAGQAWAEDQNGQSLEEPVYLAAMCFLKGDQVSGLNKICYYDCLGSLNAITIASYQVCPLSINR